MNFPAFPPRLGGAGPSQADVEAQQIQYWKSMTESCPFKMVLSGGAGFAMGGFFGLFMSSMRYDTPLHTLPVGSLPAGVPANTPFTSLPTKTQIKLGLQDMGRSTYSSAKNFGRIGAIFSMSECIIEGLRGRNDLTNGLVAGGITGGIISRAGGPRGVAVGAAGFAVFSYGIEWYMRSGEDERRFPVI